MLILTLHELNSTVLEYFLISNLKYDLNFTAELQISHFYFENTKFYKRIKRLIFLCQDYCLSRFKVSPREIYISDQDVHRILTDVYCGILSKDQKNSLNKLSIYYFSSNHNFHQTKFIFTMKNLMKAFKNLEEVEFHFYKNPWDPTEKGWREHYLQEGASIFNFDPKAQHKLAELNNNWQKY